MSPSPLTIRPARLEDAETITRFNVAMALETEALALDPARAGRGVRALLADAQKGLYFVAERDGAPVGQLMITYEWSDWRDAFWWWIQSVWIEPRARRAGVYRALYAHVVEAAKAATPERCCGVRLYVERENAKAQATYRALGMAQAKYELFEAEL
jgi:ribosomal protein S18 acetylase RimI-like enzyme